jgi:hypothetical protein
MKSYHALLTIVLLLLSSLTFAQSDAQKTFDRMKTLAGTWEGHVTTAPPMPEMQNAPIKVSLRVTSMGNALMHEMSGPGRPDNPITMMYLEGDRLMLTHYCDAGNRPRMTGKMSADGKIVHFDFLDISGNTQHGHMQNSMFTVVDDDHHTEDWTFMMGDKPVQAHFDLQRAK